MSDVVLVAIVAAIPATVAALVSFGNSRKAKVIIEKTDVIHELTNSNLSKVKDELKLANARIEKLETLLLAKKEQ